MRAVLVLMALVVGASACADDPTTVATTPDPPADDPACAALEAFTDELTSGIAYDDEGSVSPAALASTTDAAFSGHLTDVERVSTGEGLEAQAFARFGVEVDEVVTASDGVEPGRTVEVDVQVGPGQDERALTDAFPPGAPVAVFAYDDGSTGGLVAGVEGFTTSCGSGLLGWTGHGPGWAGLRTVEDVMDATEAADPDQQVLHLYVSNQSFDDDPIAIEVAIDDEVVVDRDFLVEGQHNWIEFPLVLDPGPHELVATSGTGVGLTETFTIGHGPLWAVVDYWWYPDDGPRHFSFETSTEPIGFA